MNHKRMEKDYYKFDMLVEHLNCLAKFQVSPAFLILSPTFWPIDDTATTFSTLAFVHAFSTFLVPVTAAAFVQPASIL